MKVHSLLGRLHELGGTVELGSDNRIKISAPEGVLTDEFFQELQSVRDELRDLIAQQVALRSENGLKAKPRPSIIPLSYAQSRLWFLQTALRDSSYNNTISLRIFGPLREECLKSAINAIVGRHELLRTTYEEVDGKPHQVILPELKVMVPTEDIRGYDRSFQESYVREAIATEEKKVFDLATGPLLRAKIYRLGDEDYVFTRTLHHIVSDGWSESVFSQEVTLLYERCTRGEQLELPPLVAQYADYAIWQRQKWDAGTLEEGLQYWRRRLSGAPPRVDLNTDRARSVGKSRIAGVIRTKLPKELSAKLKQFCREQRTTLFMMLLAAYSVILSRYSGQVDIVVGSPIAGRINEDIEPLIGFFVNMIALRISVDQTSTFTDLLRGVNEITLDAYKHQEVPFERIVEELQPERSLDSTPFINVTFAVNNNPHAPMELVGLKVIPLNIGEQIARFDLELYASEISDEIEFYWQYSSEVFERWRIEQMASHLMLLIERVLDAPTANLQSVGLLSAAQRIQLLSEFNPAPTQLVNGTLPDLFERIVEQIPFRPALIFEEAVLTYQELNEESNKLACHLQEMGIGVEGKVAIALDRSFEMVIGLFAILKIGATYIPLEAGSPAQRTREILEDCRPRVVLTHSPRIDQVKVVDDSDVTVVNVDETAAWQDKAPLNPDRESLRHTARHLAYIIYTSGSTGRPKGVMVEHRSVVNRLRWMIDGYGLGPQEIILQKTPINFDVSVWEVFGTLLAGGVLVLAKPNGHKDPHYLSQVIHRHKISTVHFVPSMLQVFLKHVNADALSSLKNVICSGEALSPTLLKRCVEYLPKAAVHNLYGPTEASVDVSAWTYNGIVPDVTIPIGRPIDNAKIYILDPSGDLVPVGVYGELHIGGVPVARGYLNRPELTTERFIADPFSSTGGLMYKTGDLGRWLPDGSIEFHGRNDSQVKIRGNRVELGEIESQLMRFPGIHEAAVTLRENIPGENRLIAFYSASEQLDEAKIREFLEQELPDYMLPSDYVHLPSLPVTANGKLDRAALPTLGIKPSVPGRDILPSNQLNLLCQLFAEALNIPHVAPDDNFFRLGGHSLLVITLVSRIKDVFGIQIAVPSVFEHPIPSHLLPIIKDGEAAGYEVSVRRRSECVPLAYAQLRLWFLHQLGRDNAHYNMVDASRVRGSLDVTIVEAAVKAIVDRHEVLRTTFGEREGNPVQVVHPSLHIEVQLYALEERDPQSQQNEIDAAIRAFQTQSFDLSKGPLLQVALYRLQPKEHVLLRVMHHIVSDGWSEEIFEREFVTIYEALLRGNENNLPPLEIQYVDFALWQKEQWENGSMKRGLAWWKEALNGAPEQLNLPADRPRPVRQTFSAGIISADLSPEDTAKWRNFSQKHDVTTFMLLITAFGVLLTRYSGESKVAIGSPIANRQDRKLEGLIGFFVNMLAVPISVNAANSFVSLLEQTRSNILKCYEFQDVPFEKLVEELRPDRRLDSTPIFQVVLEYQNVVLATTIKRSFTSLTINGLPRDLPRVRYDLELHVRERADYLEMYWQFNRDLFDGWRIEQMSKHLSHFLGEVMKNPDAPIEEISFLSESERGLLLESTNNTCRMQRDVPLSEIFERQVTRYPNATAIWDAGFEHTYKQVNTKANQLAHLLISRGINQEDIVAVALPRSVDMIVAMLGIMKAGAAYLPLDTTHPRERLSFMLDDAQPVFVLTDTEFASQWPNVANPIILDQPSVITNLEGYPRSNPDGENLGRRAGLENLAYIIYTSGSTGAPKAVALTHSGFPSLIQSQIGGIGLSSSSRVLQFASPTFDACLWEITLALTSGGSLIIVPNVIRNSPDLQDFILDHEITHALIPPPLLATFKHYRSGFLPTLLVGGEACPADLADRWAVGRRLVNAYGPSETTICVTLSDPLAPGGGVPLGQPVLDSKIYILDERLEPVPLGVSGELYITGPALARGYLRRGALTADRFVANPFSTRGERMYRTGDLVRRRADQEIEFVGRVDTQVKLRGFRIELEEIEAVLRRHPLVQDAISTVSSSVAGDKRLYGYVLLKSQEDPRLRESDAHVQHWQELYDATYKKSIATPTEADFTGWKSSYDGLPIPDAEMSLWLDETVARIKSFAPRAILEIGCGTGLLVTRLAGMCERYVGIDFSEEALLRVRSQVTRRGDLSHVELRLGYADDINVLEQGTFDLIILNSVIQYFPDQDYLERVLNEASRLLGPGGRIFVGDVRSLTLLPAFRSSVVLAQSADEVAPEELRKAVERSIQLEEELVVSPQFFERFVYSCPDMAYTQMFLKEANYLNELSKFRYDIVLTKGSPEKLQEPGLWMDWDAERRWRLTLQTAVAEGFEPVAIRNVPDRRVIGAISAVESLRSCLNTTTVAELKRSCDYSAGEDPTDIYAIARELKVGVIWLESSRPGTYTVIFRPKWMLETTAIHFEDEVGQQFTNVPYKSPKTDGTEDVLRSYAARFLPDYMIPSSITVLDKWPLNANGKVDRRSLPVPNRETPAAIEAVSETESAICKLFAEVLKVDSVSSNDNFFSLGGHSLLAVSLISRIRAKFQRKILVDTLFEAPTPRELAHRLDSLTIANPYGRILALRKVGKLPPFICFPPAGGIGWVYAGLSGSVDQDRPIYCLQASGIMNGEPMLNTIAEIVNDYLILVKKVQPQGPYYFTGWSFGGIVAHEAACELQRRGEEIAFLSILDTRPVYPRTIEFVQEEHSKIDNASTTIEARLNQYLHLSKQHVGEDWPSNLGPSELHNILELTKQTTKIMANTNHYSIFNGDLLLIAAEYGALFEEGWKPYVTGQIETHQLNCKHLEVTTTGPLKKIGILFEEYMRAASRSFHEVPE